MTPKNRPIPARIPGIGGAVMRTESFVSASADLWFLSDQLVAERAHHRHPATRAELSRAAQLVEDAARRALSESPAWGDAWVTETSRYLTKHQNRRRR